jgi:oxygen-independent coproporphyrinogen-3 oxidase
MHEASMSIRFFTNAGRRFLVGSHQEFVFNQMMPEQLVLPAVEKIGIYIHIPFCRSICPFCPYNKIKYDKNLTAPYVTALLKEIALYYERVGKIEISSIYIGGGTPTTLVDELGIMLGSIREKFNVAGDICIETSVVDITPDTLLQG